MHGILDVLLIVNDGRNFVMWLAPIADVATKRGWLVEEDDSWRDLS